MSKESGLPLDNPPSERKLADSYIKCPYCPYITKFPGALQRHKSRLHEREQASERKGKGSGERENSRYAGQLGFVVCPKCGASWGNQRWLDLHLLWGCTVAEWGPEWQ